MTTVTTATDDTARAKDVLELEAVAARAWPARETEELDGWLLRAAGGSFTQRANSAVPIDAAAIPGVVGALHGSTGVPPSVDRIVAWYRDRGYLPRLALPVPPMRELRSRLAAHGWVGSSRTLFMTAGIADVLSRCRPREDLPDPSMSDRVSDDWARGYERGRELAHPQARAVVEGGAARFGTLHLDDEVAAIVRTTIEGEWAGIAPVEVVPRHRRRGLATHLLGCSLEEASAHGATRVWLQVLPDNGPAVALYRRLGFEVHHEYWYDTPPDDGADE